MNHKLATSWCSLAIFFSLMVSAAIPRTVAAQGLEPFLGQLALVGFNFCPRGWVEADGQILSIDQNSALFSLYGTTYGGDGRTTFGLPDLRGRAPIHEGSGPGLQSYALGQKGGAENLTLTVNQMPLHNHEVNVTNLPGDKAGPGSKYLASGTFIYTEPPVPPQNERVMDPGMISFSGDGQQIQKRSPFLAMKWCVATIGVYPSRN